MHDAFTAHRQAVTGSHYSRWSEFGRRFRILLLPLFAIVQPGVTANAAGGRQGLQSCPPQTPETVTVRSVDPHLDIVLTDGRRLRLMGIRPPRGTSGWPGLSAMAQGALAGWIVGSPVRAEITAGPADRWGRLAARLWLADGVAVGPGLIDAGWAVTDTITAPKLCLKAYLTLEESARQAKLGLWSDDSYRPIGASDLPALTARTGSLVLAEGTVLSVNRWKSLTFLNFSRRYSQGLAVMLTRRSRQAFEQSGMPPESLKGKRVRVRGLLERSNGRSRSPRMRLQTPSAIEILP
ncbi:MAG: thermonuclease family protein [Hyphomicrobiales bacterium]|nr:thermonuclease family protein [Hyphomicrobiales bacterium]